MIQKARLYYINSRINKLKAKKHLTERESIKLAEYYAEKCTYEIQEMRKRNELQRGH